MRGKHFLVFATVASAAETRRQLVETANFPPLVAFSHKTIQPTSASSLSVALPKSIKLMTLTSNYAATNGGKVLLRLAHLYALGEHPTLSLPVNISLKEVFGKTGLQVKSATETSLTANQDAAVMDAAHAAGGSWTADPVLPRRRLNPLDPRLEVTVGPMEVRTFLVEL